MRHLSLATISKISIHEGGLSETEAQEQRARFGTNNILDSEKKPWQEIVLETLQDPMLWFLGGASALFLVVGQTTDALTLLAAILPLTFMDAFLHWRTRSATVSLKQNLNTTISVIRDSIEKKMNSQSLVPGDLIRISRDEVIPADGLIERSEDLQVDESALTGESLPVRKRPYSLEIKAKATSEIIVEPEVLVSAGTKILTGDALVRVILTGQQTDYGQIIRSVIDMPLEKTPLQIGVGKLVRSLVLVALFFCATLALIRLYQGHGWMDSILAAATLAIAAIPEEFPVVFTFFLGVGVFRLAKRRALVRRAVSVENIGRITHICTDKTGTITEGKLTLSHLHSHEPATSKDLIEAARMASDPDAIDPLDLAILKFAEQNSRVERRIAIHRYPFTEGRKKETSVLRLDDRFVAYLKGAPETVLQACLLTDQEKRSIQNHISDFAKTGHKVLACATKALGSFEIQQAEPDHGFQFLGLLAFEDPARPEVPLAIARARSYGIKVIMLTGDHPVTAEAIARDIGLGGDQPSVVSADENPENFDSVDVVARCTPVQKLNIVKALKRQGHLVAVTGDGINDVPALKAADVGIAMGLRGSQSAKEVSSIILADDNFRTIVSAIQEGRQLFENLRLAFEYLLLIHFPFVLSAALLPLFGYPIVYLPIHIVWLELIIHPSAILAFQTRSDDQCPPSKKNFFSRKDIVRIVMLGIIVLAIIAWLYLSDLKNGFGEGIARTRALVALSLWSASSVAALTQLRGHLAKVIVLLTILMTFFLIQYGISVAEYLHIVPLNRSQWIEIIGLVLGAGVLLKILKG